MLNIEVTEQALKITQRQLATDSLVGNNKNMYSCQFTFDNTWDGFTKTAVFQNKKLDKFNRPNVFYDFATLDESNQCTIPLTVLKDQSILYIGVCGVKQEQNYATVFSQGILVRQGACPDNEQSNVPENFFFEVLEIMEETKQIANERGIPNGGSTGQVLTKISSTNYDTEWRNISGTAGTTFVHSQDTPSSTWAIAHNLNKYPSVTVVDSAGTVVVGQVIYADSNNLSVQFSSGFSGKAYLN